MFQLDDKFLQDIGLGELPEEQKKPFLQHVYNELELRVGTKLSDGMTDSQLTEFEAIIDHKDDTIMAWLDKNVPDYKNDSLFVQLQKSMSLAVNDPNLRAEYAATKWLGINRPDYKEVVTHTLEELREEIIANHDAILS